MATERWLHEATMAVTQAAEEQAIRGQEGPEPETAAAFDAAVSGFLGYSLRQASVAKAMGAGGFGGQVCNGYRHPALGDRARAPGSPWPRRPWPGRRAAEHRRGRVGACSLRACPFGALRACPLGELGAPRDCPLVDCPRRRTVQSRFWVAQDCIPSAGSGQALWSFAGWKPAPP